MTSFMTIVYCSFYVKLTYNSDCYKYVQLSSLAFPSVIDKQQQF